MVASIYLRPEPQYWIHRESDPATKAAKVLEAISHAPRPSILYVTKREDADDWLDRISQERPWRAHGGGDGSAWPTPAAWTAHFPGALGNSRNCA